MVTLEGIRTKYKPKEGYNVHININEGKMYAAVFQQVEIPNKRYGTKDIANQSIGNIGTRDEKEYIEFLTKYLDVR